MKLKKQNFKLTNLTEKIEHLIEYSKQQLKKNHKLDDCFFLFDKECTVYMIPIENEKFLNLKKYRRLFNKIASNIIKEVEKEYNTTITNTLYIYVDVFDITTEDKVDLNIDWKEDINRRNSMIIINESKFSTNIVVYDYIHWFLKDGEHSILSEEPIKKINLSKLDSDHSVKGLLTNILK